ncbi:MAG: galactose-1-phosphate uridylyltransferase [bacterium]
MEELRKDPILGRWVIIATSRSRRPASFVFKKDEEDLNKICPFCEGNENLTPPEIYAIRNQNTAPNTPNWQVRVIPNKYPALGIDGALVKKGVGLYDTMTGFGAHEVIIETPHHNKEMKDLSIDEIKTFISVLQYRIEDLYKDKRFRYALIFKNKGKEAGASLSHPHHQLIATPITPKRVREELEGAELYFRAKERCIFCDIIQEELNSGQRIVYENKDYVVFCPFASSFPFEIWILPKVHDIDFYASSVKNSIHSLAEVMKIVFMKIFLTLDDAQYNYVIHAAPNRFPRRDYWHTIGDDFHWHIEIIPRLTKIAGFEWGTGFYINPTSPEDAAKALRETKVEI